MKNSVKHLTAVAVSLLVLGTAAGTPSASATQPTVGLRTTTPFDVGATCQPAQPDSCSLRQLADLRGMHIGATVAHGRLSDPAYASTLSTQFNSVTPDNDLKWTAVQPAPGDWQFAAAETDLAFADANGMAFRGHNLIYNQDPRNPAWVTSISDPTQLRQAVQTEIQTVVGHFAGRIKRWDVVNEPIATFGVGPQDSVFQRELGPGWVDWCFQLAHDADPSAELWLNEYGTDWYPGKFDALVSFVKGMQKRGVPIYGVGLEMHRLNDDAVDVPTFVSQMKKLARMGLKISLTEVDVPIPPNDDAALQLQADVYGGIVGGCLQVPQCLDVTTWGLDDGHTWLDSLYVWPTPTRPLLFDANFTPKPAYDSVRLCLDRSVLKAAHVKKKLLPPCVGAK